MKEWKVRIYIVMKKNEVFYRGQKRIMIGELDN